MPLIPLAMYKTPRRAAQARHHQVVTMLAPTAGLNYRDPFLMLGPKDAVELNNFIAKPTGVVLRGGYQKHVTGLGGTVNTIMPYMAQNPLNNKLFAAVTNKFFDVTNSADAPTALVANNNSVDGTWSSIMFNAPTINFLCATSPSGGYWTYDEAGGWVNRTAALTGLNASAGCIAAWKNRLWIVGEGTAKAFYMNVSSIQGPVKELDLGPLLKHGGHIVGMTNWTMNAGLDLDDYLVFFGSQGDVVVYQGTDPDDISTFALKGVWYMGRPPVGNRFFVEYGGELLVLSELGLLPLSKMVNGQVADAYSVMSGRISPALNPMVTRLIDNKQWEVDIVASDDLLIVKPPREYSTYTQYAMFIQTGAWSTFTGIPMNTMGRFEGLTYFGDEDGNVQTVLSPKKDGVNRDGTGGTPIEGQSQSGFSDFGSSANLKLFTLARPILISGSAPSVQAQMNIEYTFNPVYASPSFINRTNGVWDDARWDVAQWAGSTNTYSSWVGLQNMGYYGSLRVAVKGEVGTTFISSHVMLQAGGVM